MFRKKISHPLASIGTQNPSQNDLLRWNTYDNRLTVRMQLNKDFREFIALLNAHEAEYLLVGGYAVMAHGYVRNTGDMDVWINPVEQNAEKVIKALNEFGFSFPNLTVADFIKPDNFVQLGYEPNRIDIINNIDGVTFDACYPNRLVVEDEGLTINVINHGDLIYE